MKKLIKHFWHYLGICVRSMALRKVPFAEELLFVGWPRLRLSYAECIFSTNQYAKAKRIAAGLTSTNRKQQLQIERIQTFSQVIEGDVDWPQFNLPNVVAYKHLSVLMALHNSAPYDFAGYWFRTKSILQCLIGLGATVRCATRPGYPWDLQKHRYLPVMHAELVDGVEFFRLSSENAPYKQGSDFRYVSNYALQLAILAKQRKSSVIHGHSNYLNGLAAIEASRIAGCKSIYEARGFWHITGVAKNSSYDKTGQFAYESKMEIMALKHADRIVTLSGAMKDLIGTWGIDINKVHVIPNAVDIDKFKPRECDSVLRSRWGKNRFVIGFIGSLAVYEGLVELITAVISLNASGYSVSLVVVGSGDVETKLKHISKGYDFIHLVGRIPHEEVNTWYSSFDLCAYPRTDDVVCRYVPPMKVLEAMAMEIPVIVSDLAPLREMVTHNETGLICQPSSVKSLSEAIEYAINHPEQLRAMGQNGLSWVCRHRTWEKNAERYKELYRSLHSTLY